MGENAKKIGDRLEGFGEKLYSRLGWEELTRDQEIKCIKSIHKTSTDKQKRTHGVDLYHQCYDPYKGRSIGIITECKNYEWESINPSNIQKWFDQLVGTLECAQISAELKDQNSKCDSTYNGLLLINANDGKYDDKTFRKYLKTLECKGKRNALNIFIAANKEIERWNAMFDLIENKFRKDSKEFNFYYPSIMDSQLHKSDQLSLSQLFSSYVFAECIGSEQQQIADDETRTKTIRKNIIFSFDKITEKSSQYLCSLFKALQLENANEFVFCFYPESEKDFTIIEGKFEAYARKSLNSDKIRIQYMTNPKINIVDYPTNR